MGEIAEAFRTGGIWMYLILMMGLLTFPWLLAQTVLGIAGKRLPAAVWWVGPCLIAAIGLVGTGVGMTETLAALEHASPENRQRLMAKGLALSLNTVAFASLVNAVAGGIVALGAGLTNAFGADGEVERDGLIAGAAIGLACVGSLGLAVWVIASTSMGTSALFVAAALFFGGIGCGLAGLNADPRPEPDNRRVSDRITAMVGAAFGVASAGLFAWTTGFIEVFRALEDVTPGNRAEMMNRGMEMVGQTAWIGAVGVVLALLIGGIVVARVRGRITSRPVTIDVVTCLIVFLPVVGAFGYVASQSGPFQTAFEETILEAGDSEEGPAE